MTVRHIVEVTCDDCEFTVPDYGSGTRVRAQLRQQGWSVGRPGGKDRCPDCKGRKP